MPAALYGADPWVRNAQLADAGGASRVRGV
jgi:hypothetical protein